MTEIDKRFIKTGGCNKSAWIHWLTTEKGQKEKLIVGVAITDDVDFHPIDTEESVSGKIVYDSAEAKVDEGE